MKNLPTYTHTHTHTHTYTQVCTVLGWVSTVFNNFRGIYNKKEIKELRTSDLVWSHLAEAKTQIS